MTRLSCSLLTVIQSFLLLVEAQQTLSLDSIVDLNTNSLPSPPTFGVPSTTNLLTASVALCAASDDPPRFFVTNDTTISQPSISDVDNVNTYEIVLNSEGFGSRQLTFTNGGIISVVEGSATTPFEMFVSTNNASSETSYPLFGDTTSNQAIVFSPSFDPPLTQEPSFPNFTLPAANLSLPIQPSSPINYTLVYVPTSSTPFNSLPRTACAVNSQINVKGVATLSAAQSAGLWLRDTNGWRWEWLLSGLTPKTNYTAYTLQQGQLAASQPINFVTKSPTFNCPFLHRLPFCPSISYSVPLAPPHAPASAHTASTIPFNVSNTIISYLANFTTTLTTLACGRDHYSPLVTCNDCQAAYRTWLCTVSFPRCTEAPGSPSGAQGAQVPLSAIQPVNASATPRNPTLPPFGLDYETLLPCLETCNAADRACPIFLGFKCPLPQFTAASSYGVGFMDSGEDGVLGGGSTGVAQDMYGNIWCNGG